MFNNTDCIPRELQACIKAAFRIEQHPVDYFRGLPDHPPSLPKNILMFSRKAPFDRGRRDVHHRCLLIACLRGAGEVIIDEQVVRLSPGCLAIIAPHQFHHYSRFAEKDLVWLFISFELDDLGALNRPERRMISMTPLQQECLRQLTQEYASSKGKQGTNPGIAYLLAWLLEGFRKGRGRKRENSRGLQASPAPRRLIQEAARFVHGHASETIHIPDVARAVGLSESRLRAVFKAQAGIGLGTYIRRLRLHRARTLVLSSELRLKEIAERCGFDSIYSFSRAFRREIGISPQKYRQPENRHSLPVAIRLLEANRRAP